MAPPEANSRTMEALANRLPASPLRRLGVVALLTLAISGFCLGIAFAAAQI
jgi:hypothetical protein